MSRLFLQEPQIAAESQRVDEQWCAFICLFYCRILSATDEDTDDETLVFLIVKQPRFGVLQLKGQPATKVTQEEVKDGLVSYLHTSGEIGTSSQRDSVSFIVSDQNFLATTDMPVYDLNITITPVNNQKPVIQIGSPILVAEGESFRFSRDVLSVTDPDSKTKTIQLMITQQPQWGYIENTKPSAGSEKSNVGKRVNSFSYGDILDGSINYVQANHRGVEPVMDQFELYATDGKLNSKVTTLITLPLRTDNWITVLGVCLLTVWTARFYPQTPRTK